MQLTNTKAIVLRVVKYGETSLIITAYTELFGIQSYMAKGVRVATKKNAAKANYFQCGAILDLTVYQNQYKNLQLIKDYNWSIVYKEVHFSVPKNSVALFMIEVLQHALKQPEANPELFYFIEDTLTSLDIASPKITANIPLAFCLQLSSLLGFGIQGNFTEENTILDLEEGFFVSKIPAHPFFIDGELAKIVSEINGMSDIQTLENITLNKESRKQLLHYLLQFIRLHITDFGTLKSLSIVQEVLS